MFVALVRLQHVATRFGQELGRERLETFGIRHLPRLGGIGDVAIGQQHHRGHVFDRHAAGFDRNLEGIARAARSDHRHRSIAVAAVDRLIEVALLGLCRQASRRPATLRIDHHQRQLGHDAETQSLGLERDAGAGGRGNAQLARITSADRGAHGGDLVFRLEGGDAEFLEPREVMQDRRCGRDRIAAEEQRQLGQLPARDEAERDGLGTCNRAIQARIGRHRRQVHLLQRAGKLRRLSIGMACVERGNIGGGNVGCLGELLVQPVVQRLARTVEHPQREAQRPHVLAAQPILFAEAERLHGFQSARRNIERQHVERRESIVVERVGVVLRLVEVALGKLARVDDHQPTGLERRQVHLQRRRVHRDQHIGRVARSVDLARSEIDLECRNTEQRPLRRTDFRREVGECREIVARQRGRQGELPTGELHSVARVACKPDDDRVGGFGEGSIGGWRRLSRH